MAELKSSKTFENLKTAFTGDVKDKILCDLFAGTNVVGLHYKKGCKIITNDLQYLYA